jgi:sterol desaturase/sphingolipid hydroxylase (fatty acid hydroxylase superfamily)
VKFSFKTEDLPNSLTLISQLIFLMITEDIAFYFFHKLMHHRFFYSYFHKVHHNFVNTVSISAKHFHPVDYFISVLLPGAFGPTLLGSHLHIATDMIWIAFRTGEGVDGHSGYEFPWSMYRLIPFSASASYHDFHHSHNVGNYSSFLTIWDSIFGTNAAYIKY